MFTSSDFQVDGEWTRSHEIELNEGVEYDVLDRPDRTIQAVLPRSIDAACHGHIERFKQPLLVILRPFF